MTVLRRPRAALRTLPWIVLLAVIELGLRLSTLPAVCRRLGVTLDIESASAVSGSVWPVPRRYEKQVRALLRASAWWPFGDTCLRRCLLLGVLLRKDRPVLRIGIRRDDAGVFGAHSWLEVGNVTLDPAAADFAALQHPAA